MSADQSPVEAPITDHPAAPKILEKYEGVIDPNIGGVVFRDQQPKIPGLKKRRKITRAFNARVEYRGEERLVVLDLDINAGTIAVRLRGCSRRKVYQVKDLFTFKPESPQLSLPLQFEE